MGLSSQYDRRRGKRIHLSFHVEISGISADGLPFCDQATASDVSERGCQIILAHQVRPEDVLTLRVIRKDRDSDEQSFPYKVMWVAPRADAWAAGLAALDEGNPWRVNFPAESIVRS